MFLFPSLLLIVVSQRLTRNTKATHHNCSPGRVGSLEAKMRSPAPVTIYHLTFGQLPKLAGSQLSLLQIGKNIYGLGFKTLKIKKNDPGIKIFYTECP